MKKRERIKRLETEVMQLARLVRALYAYQRISLLPNGAIEYIESWDKPRQKRKQAA